MGAGLLGGLGKSLQNVGDNMAERAKEERVNEWKEQMTQKQWKREDTIRAEQNDRQDAIRQDKRDTQTFQASAERAMQLHDAEADHERRKELARIKNAGKTPGWPDAKTKRYELLKLDYEQAQEALNNNLLAEDQREELEARAKAAYLAMTRMTAGAPIPDPTPEPRPEPKPEPGAGELPPRPGSSNPASGLLSRAGSKGNAESQPFKPGKEYGPKAGGRFPGEKTPKSSTSDEPAPMGTFRGDVVDPTIDAAKGAFDWAMQKGMDLQKALQTQSALIAIRKNPAAAESLARQFPWIKDHPEIQAALSQQ